ncbi:hypothetical protein MMPV_001128 [Pyropia vietnamensis]
MAPPSRKRGRDEDAAQPGRSGPSRRAAAAVAAAAAAAATVVPPTPASPADYATPQRVDRGGVAGGGGDTDSLLDDDDEVGIRDTTPVASEPEDGEDLLGDDMWADYAPDARLDAYEVDAVAEADAAAAGSGGALNARGRRAVEAALAARDAAERRARGLPPLPSAVAMPSTTGGSAADAPPVRDDLPAAFRVDSESEGPSVRAGGRPPTGRRERRPPAAGASAASPADGSSRGGMGGAASVDGSRPPPRWRHAGGAGMGSRSTSAAATADLDDGFVLERFNGPLREWLSQERPRREVRRRFATVLREAADGAGGSVYRSRIRAMAAANGQSLVVAYPHLAAADALLAVWVADAPAEMLDVFNEVATEMVLVQFPKYQAIHREVFVRIADLPVVDALRDVRHIHLNCFIKVSGVVTRRTGVFPHLRLVKLDCGKCRTVIPTPAVSNGGSGVVGGGANAAPERAVLLCPNCNAKGPFTVNSEQTVFGNYQRLTLQEAPGSVPAGRLPRSKQVILLGDLIDVARPGDEVTVTGIYRHNVDAAAHARAGFPVFSTVLEANYVEKVGADGGVPGGADGGLTDEDVAAVRALAQDPRLAERVYASVAPSIHGHAEIKRALALALFGGQAKEVGEKHRIRGDINVLLLGDPGTAKSQFLKWVEKTTRRAVYTTGKGASAVGLTAAVRKDPVTREWALEGGALVLADRGVCLIDEFDKMNDADRTSIHEAMEQQSISISKAGIVTSLQARCSVFAAANPVKGRYDASVSFAENVDLTEPILSRFDVLCVVRDVVDAAADEALATFVVDSHVRAHPLAAADAAAAAAAAVDEEEDDDDLVPDDEAAAARAAARAARAAAAPSTGAVEPIPSALFRKYLVYARSRVRPRLGNLDKDKLAGLYLELRREAAATGGLPIALRHLESAVRLAEAHARLHLREHVRDDDVSAAVAVTLASFFGAQKYSVGRALRRTFGKYLAAERDDGELLSHVLGGLVRDYAAAAGAGRRGGVPGVVEVEVDDFEARARELGIHSCHAFYSSRAFGRRGFSLARGRGKIVYTPA